ncbi:MAG: hypothetical protein ACREKN_06145 [Longimicrobiaceae bacterium]
MGFGRWLKRQLAGPDSGDDVPPGSSLMDAVLGRDEERVRSLGEYNADSYPGDLAELLRRRQQVTEAVLSIDITDAGERRQAIPRLRELLRTYPHPLVYEMLLHAYVDSDRYEEAKGLAFAARARREECARSEHPEIRAETEHLREWTSDEVERLREEREGKTKRG